MLPSRGAMRHISAQRHLSTRAISSGRQFGTLGRTTGFNSPLRTRQHVAPVIIGSVASSRALSLWGYGSSKKEATPVEGTTPAADDKWAEIRSGTTPATKQPTAADAVNIPAEAATTSSPFDAASAAPEADLTAISDIVNHPDILNMPEHIGYLKALGLEYGWGVTSSMQWVLEHIHIYSDLSWGGSIIATALAMRLAMLYPLIKSVKFNANMKAMQETARYKQVQEDVKKTIRSGDRQAQQQAMGLNKLLRKEFKVPFTNMLWGFVPIPFSIGFFRILSGMAKIPVPGMETGGFWWFTDLTVADPFYILPAAATAVMVATLTVSSRTSTPSQKELLKKMGYVLTPVMLIATSFLSAGVNLMAVVTALVTLGSNLVLTHPAVRRALGIRANNPTPVETPKLTVEPPRSTAPAYTPTGMKERLTSSINDATKGLSDGMASVTGSSKSSVADKAEKKRREMIQKLEEKRQQQERDHFEAKYKRGGPKK